MTTTEIDGLFESVAKQRDNPTKKAKVAELLRENKLTYLFGGPLDPIQKCDYITEDDPVHVVPDRDELVILSKRLDERAASLEVRESKLVAREKLLKEECRHLKEQQARHAKMVEAFKGVDPSTKEKKEASSSKKEDPQSKRHPTKVDPVLQGTNLEEEMRSLHNKTGRFLKTKDEERPIWKKSLDNTVASLTGGSIGTSPIRLAWDGLQSIIHKYYLTDEAVEVLCRMCPIRTDKDEGPGTSQVSIRNPYEFVWAMANSRRDFQGVMDFLCDHKRFTDYSALETFIDLNWDHFQAVFLTFLFRSAKRYLTPARNGITRKKTDWFDSNVVVVPCVGSDHWSAICLLNVSNVINYIHDWIRVQETGDDENVKNVDQSEIMLTTIHLDSLGRKEHSHGTTNMVDMIFLFALYTCDIEHSLSIANIRAQFYTRSVNLKSIRQRGLDCGLYTVYNSLMLLFSAEEMRAATSVNLKSSKGKGKKTNVSTDLQRIYNTARKKYPYSDYTSNVAKMACLIFDAIQSKYTWGGDAENGPTHRVILPSQADLDKLDADEDILRRWAVFESRVEKASKATYTKP